MKPALDTQTAESTAKKQTTNTPQEPKRLSKFALWRRKNPNGAFIVKDWKAINK